MHVVVYRILRGLRGRLEQRAYVDVEADVGECGGDHLGAAVMTVLAHLDHQHARAAAFGLGELLDRFLDVGKARVAFVGRAIDPRERLDLGPVPSEFLFHRHADFPHCGACARGLDRRVEQVAALGCPPCQLIERRRAGVLVTLGADALQTGHLSCAHLDVVDVENVDRLFLVAAVLVDADDHLGAAVDTRLTLCRGFLDPELRHAGGHGLGHAAHLLDLLDQLPGRLGQIGGQLLDVIRPRQRIDDIGDAGLFLQDQLGVAGDAGGMLGRQADRLIERIGVQRLGAAQHRRKRFVGRAHNIVVGVLFGQAHAGGLAMGAQHRRLGVLRFELLHHPRPEQTRGAQLGGLHEEVHADGEKERQTRREAVDVHARSDGGTHVFAPVRDGEGQFLHEVRARLLHVVARDRDRVELRHVVRGVFDDVPDDPHRRLRRIDIGVADHEFLENVVLDRARKLGAVMALLFARDDEIGEDRDHRAVHRHGDRDLIERDAVEEDLHVLDRVDGHAGLAHIALHPGVVAVIAAVGGEVESDGNTLLARGQGTAVEGVRFLGGGEARVLPDRPGTACVHRGLHAAGEGRLAGDAAQMLQPVHVLGGVKRLDVDPLQRLPREIVKAAPTQFAGSQFLPTRLRVLLVGCHMLVLLP